MIQFDEKLLLHRHGSSQKESGTQNEGMGVSKNGGTPKSSILKGFSIINHPFWGTPILGNTRIEL